MSNNSVVTHRTTATGRRSTVPSLFHCNRCKASISGSKFYICSCDCLFCERCTFEHFGQANFCPVCKKRFDSDEDFLAIGENSGPMPSSSVEERNLFLHLLFSKPPSHGDYFSLTYICGRALRLNDLNRAVTKFLMKQLMAASNVARNNPSIEAFKRREAEYNHQVQQRDNQIKQLKLTLAEKEQQILQLKQAYVSGTRAGSRPGSGPVRYSIGHGENSVATGTQSHNGPSSSSRCLTKSHGSHAVQPNRLSGGNSVSNGSTRSGFNPYGNPNGRSSSPRYTVVHQQRYSSGNGAQSVSSQSFHSHVRN